MAIGVEGPSKPRTVPARGPARSHWPTTAVLALCAYLPLLVGGSGRTTSDTKAYLYLDPGRFLRQSTSLWSPDIGMGTVLHQQIGYLFPMGPFFWATAQLHVPTWVAQRLWMGTLLFAAGTGIAFLARCLGLHGAPTLLAGLAYELSPYLLQYIDQQSVLLLSWAAAGWLLGLTIRALRRGGWRDPVLFGAVAAVAGGSNGTAIAGVGLAVVLWFPYAIWAIRETRLREAVGVALRMALMTAALSVWWIVALVVEGRYGLDILRYTETAQTTASTSLSSEVLRGLGYWYFYGREVVGPWHLASVGYEQWPWLIVVSFVLPALALLCAGVVRWTFAPYFGGLIVVGTTVAVGAHPYDHPSLVGAGLRTVLSSSVGAALRNTDRFAPMVVLGVALLLAGGADALVRWAPSRGHRARGGVSVGRRPPHVWLVPVVVVAAIALTVVDLPAVWTGTELTPTFLWPGHLPSYYGPLATYLDSQGGSSHDDPSRVLVEPGLPFAAYAWGYTGDSVFPALLTRPVVERNLVPSGSQPSVNLLTAMDVPIQEETFDPASIAPLARLMGVGDVVWQSNLQYWRYQGPLPQLLWASLQPTPSGLSAPVLFGPLTSDPPPASYPLFDERNLAVPASDQRVPSVAVFAVPGARPIFRTEAAQDPVVVDGDGGGLVEAASSGLLDTSATILYAGSLTGDPPLVQQALAQGADLVVTDTNQKRGERWGTLRNVYGYVQTADEIPAADPSNAPLDLFPGAPASAWTTDDLQGVQSVSASTYGNPSDYEVSDRPEAAIDNDLDTAWQIDGITQPDGQWWSVSLLNPVTTDHVVLTQPIDPKANRWITRVTLTFDGARPLTVDLSKQSRMHDGQTITFPKRTFQTLTVRIDATNWDGRSTSLLVASPVGLAEVGVGGQYARETLAVPTDLLTAAGQSSLSHRLTILLNRSRTTPYPPWADPERFMQRLVWLPTPRRFSVAGQVRLNTLLSDQQIDAALGNSASVTGMSVSTSGYLSGVPASRGSAALDGDPATAWSSPFGNGNEVGAWIRITLDHPVRFDRMDLKIVADGRHSVPTALRIQTPEGSRLVRLPPIADQASPGGWVAVPVRLPEMGGRWIKITVAAVRPERTGSHPGAELPVSIAELGIPGVTEPPTPARIPSVCRDDLLQIDGVPVWIRLSGSTQVALQHDPISFVGCGPDSDGVSLDAGANLVQAAKGNSTGFDVDAVWLDSAPGGGPMPLDGLHLSPAPSAASPRLDVLSQQSTLVTARVVSTGRPFWLVLGQSFDAGWTASLSSHGSLGAPRLVDGYANGWLVTHPPPAGTVIAITFRWAPQRTVDGGLAVSAGSAVVAFGLICLPEEARGRLRRFLRRARERSSARSAPGRRPKGRQVAQHVQRPRFGWIAAFRSGRRGVDALVAAGCGGVTLVVLPPFTPNGGAGYIWPPIVAAGLAAWVYLALRGRPKSLGGRILTLLPGALVLVTAGFVLAEASSYRASSGRTLPNLLDTANVLGWLAVVTLMAIGAVDLSTVARSAAAVRQEEPVLAGGPSPGSPEG